MAYDKELIPITLNFLIITPSKALKTYLKKQLYHMGFVALPYMAETIAEAKAIIKTKHVDFVICEDEIPDGKATDFNHFLKDELNKRYAFICNVWRDHVPDL